LDQTDAFLNGSRADEVVPVAEASSGRDNNDDAWEDGVDVGEEVDDEDVEGVDDEDVERVDDESGPKDGEEGVEEEGEENDDDDEDDADDAEEAGEEVVEENKQNGEDVAEEDVTEEDVVEDGVEEAGEGKSALEEGGMRTDIDEHQVGAPASQNGDIEPYRNQQLENKLLAMGLRLELVPWNGNELFR
jgi:hypothetical protein